MKKKITICITIAVIMAILIVACNNNKDKSSPTDTSQIVTSEPVTESIDIRIEDSTDATNEEPSGEAAAEATTKAEESGEAAIEATTEKETDAREATPATTKAVTAITKAATQPATTKAAQPQTRAPETKPAQPVTQPATQAPKPTQSATQAPKPTQPQTQAPKPTQPTTQAPKPTQPQTQAPKPTQPATKAPVWHEPEYRTEQVWVVDKAAWTEEIKTPKQVPVYKSVSYIVCTCGFETKSDDEWAVHADIHMDNEEPYACKVDIRREITGYTTEYETTYIEHPAEGHYETKQVLVKPGYWE